MRWRARGIIDAKGPRSTSTPADHAISGWLQCGDAAQVRPLGAEMLRCLIIDDSPDFLDAARRLLRLEGIDVVGVGSSGDEALRLARELRPDVTLVDIVLGPEDGFAVARRLAETDGRPAGNVILISTHGEDEFADMIHASPIIGFLPKGALSAEAIAALTAEAREREP